MSRPPSIPIPAGSKDISGEGSARRDSPLFRKFGNYELKRKLGVGGMAETVVATRRGPGGFEQEVCLKRILPAFAEDERFVEMFLSEARLAARLRHNNVVQVYDFGEEQGSYYLALELVEGLDLRGLLSALKRRGERLDASILVYLVYELLAALAYAHDLRIEGSPAGLVHRDVTPSNVLVSVHGEVKLTDFGIAKATQTSQATQSGSVKGKIPYMSPEQAQALRVDGRTDLFAVGVIVYEALAGKRPFDGPSDTATLLNITRGEYVPLAELAVDAPAPLTGFVDRLLQPNPDMRVQSAREAADMIVDLVPPPLVRRKLSELVSAIRSDMATRATAHTRRADGERLDEPQALERPGAVTTASGVRAAEPGASQRPQASRAAQVVESTTGDLLQRSPGRTKLGNRALAKTVAFSAGALLVAAGIAVSLWSPSKDGPNPEAAAALEPSTGTRKNERPPDRRSELVPVESMAPPDEPEQQPAIERAPAALETIVGPEAVTAMQEAARQAASVRVFVRPHGMVWVDGKGRGPAPVGVRLRPGTHVFQGGVAYPLPETTRRVHLGPGEQRRLVLELPQ